MPMPRTMLLRCKMSHREPIVVNCRRALNFGGMGIVMGHELTHAFDDQGQTPPPLLSGLCETFWGKQFEKVKKMKKKLTSKILVRLWSLVAVRVVN